MTFKQPTPPAFPTHAEFDALLYEIMAASNGADLLAIPGVYGPVAQFMHAGIVELWQQLQTGQATAADYAERQP